MTYTKQIVLMAPFWGAYILPDDFNPGNNLIEAYGAGSNGGSVVLNGGNGGAYAASLNCPLTARQTVYVNIGQGGEVGGNTWLYNSSSYGIPTLASQGVFAQGGGLAATGTGGQASACIGTTAYSGGAGAAGTAISLGDCSGGGGGGCAGPGGVGGNGYAASGAYGGGGGGADGGASASSQTGGNGPLGSGGGAPGVDAQAGSGGGGGAAEGTIAIGSGDGADFALYANGIGPGGGGGGGTYQGYSLIGGGGHGGGGGGASAFVTTLSVSGHQVQYFVIATGGLGGDGFLVINYTPPSGGTRSAAYG